MIFSGILTAVGFVFIAAKFSKTFLLKCLGKDWLLDLCFTLGLMIWFGSTGTISGIVISAITGLCFSLVLYVAKNTMGYIDKDQYYPPKWTPEFLGEKSISVFKGTGDFVKRFKDGMTVH